MFVSVSGWSGPSTRCRASSACLAISAATSSCPTSASRTLRLDMLASVSGLLSPEDAVPRLQRLPRHVCCRLMLSQFS